MSPRSIYNGSLGMGLVNFPIQLMTAIDNHDRPAGNYHGPHADGSYTRITMPRMCATCEVTVQQGDLVSGYEHDDGIVFLTPADKDAIVTNAGGGMEILRFVRLKEIKSLMFSGEKAYYLLPDKNPKRGGNAAIATYKMILQIMTEEDLVAVVQYTMRTTNRIAILRPEPTEFGGILVVQNMLWPDEVRSPAFSVLTEAKDVPVDQRLLPVGRSVVQAMIEDWNPAEYVDVYQQQLSKAIEARAAGQSIEVTADAPDAPPDDVSDLIAKLEASVAAKKGSKPAVSLDEDTALEASIAAHPAKGKAPAKKAPAKKAAPRKAAPRKAAAS